MSSAPASLMPSTAAYLRAQRVGPSRIGTPITFHTGPFAGRTLRARIEELQKADLGRKYGQKDRRPLDPPPVVQLRLYEVLNVATSRETERELDDYSDVEALGIVCHADLFPVSLAQDADVRGSNQAGPSSAASTRRQSTLHTDSVAGVGPSGSLRLTTQVPSTLNPYSVPGQPLPSAYAFSLPPVISAIAKPSGLPSFSPQSRSSDASVVVHSRLPDVIARIGDYPITESSMCTNQLAGALIVGASCLQYRGMNSLLFIFSDLAVKKEGAFLLRYRAFDILSAATGTRTHPALDECFGGTFRIYSTKNFPGLQPSTDLTKHISMYGVRLNSRTHERKRRKRSQVFSQSEGQFVSIAPVSIPSSAQSLTRVTRSLTSALREDQGAPLVGKDAWREP